MSAKDSIVRFLDRRRSSERRRDRWATHVATLDPSTDFEEIARITGTLEFPWDVNQALSFALFRTYAVPSIGELLARTGEFTERTQKRYDDTGLLLGAIIEEGLNSDEGMAAIRRMNQMHGSYDISNDDMRYVLSTFVVIPQRWLADFGWRPLTDAEREATVRYYAALGKKMGIRDIPDTSEGFAELLDSYEAEHFGFDAGGRAVADATLDLFATFPQNRFVPAKVSRRAAYALMDEPLLDAFGFPHPTRVERALVRCGLKARAFVLQFMPSRTEPVRARDLPTILGYPDGFELTELGTFPT